MSQVQVTGALTSPITGLALSGASIKFTATESYGDVVEGSSATYVCDDDGGYDFSVYYGTYAVYLQTSGNWDYLGKAIVNDVSVSPSTLTVLIGTNTSPLTPTDIAYAESLVASIEDSEATCAESASEALASASAAASSATESSGFATQAKAYRDETSEISGLDTVTEAVDLALSETYQYAMTKAEFFALMEQRKRQYAGSGFVEWGNSRIDSSVNSLIQSGMYTVESSGNLLQIGRGGSNFDGESRTNSPIVLVGGVSHTLYEVNSADPSYNPVKIKFPEAEQGTRSYDAATGEVIDYLTDVDPKYGDVAANLNEAVARNFEGLVGNGDFRDGSAEWTSIAATTNIADGYASFSVDALTNNIRADVNVEVGEVYEISYTGQASGAASSLIIASSISNTMILDDTMRKYTYYYTAEGPNLKLEHRSRGGCSGVLGNYSVRKVSNQPILSRQDYCFLETFHEKVSDKDIFCPLGNVQYGAATSDEGITLVKATTLGIGQGYSAFGDWDEDTEGYVAQWSTLTDAQQKACLDSPDNSMYFDAEANELIQVRYRVRVVKGNSNGWKYLTPNSSVLSNGSPQGAVLAQGFGTIPAALSDVSSNSALRGVLNSGRSTETLSDVSLWEVIPTSTIAYSGLCYALPICLVQRGNQGAYHPVYNPDGFAKFHNVGTSLDTWYTLDGSEEVLVVSTASCFKYDAQLGNGFEGSIASGSSYVGRLDQYAYYDAIYAGQVQDLRINANKQDPNRLMGDAIRKAVAGETRGKGKVPFSTFHRAGLGSDDSALRNWATWSAGGLTVYGDIPANAEVGDYFYLYDATDAFIIRSKVGSLTYGAVIACSAYTVISGEIAAINGRGTDNETYYILEKELTPEYDSLPWVDIIGSPENIMATFPNGCVGQWIPQIAPDSANYKVNLNKKWSGNGYLLKTSDLGKTWTGFADTSVNVVTNDREVNGGYVQLLSYKALSDFTASDNNTAPYGEAGNVVSGGFNQVPTGNRLQPSLTGKAGFASGTAFAARYLQTTKVYIDHFSLRLAGGSTEHTPAQFTGGSNSSSAFKALYHLIEKDGLLYLQYHGREMQHDGTDWGDDNTIPIIDGESTMLDDNGTTVKTFTHTELFPIGIADYTETN